MQVKYIARIRFTTRRALQDQRDLINQRDNYKAGKPVYCIYVAIGQKASSIAATVETLRRNGALDYTVVVAASASDSAAMRYYSPFAGVAIGEYFRDTGRLSDGHR